MNFLRNALLPLVALLGLAMLAWSGTLPDYWLQRSLPTGAPPPYPLEGVLTFSAVALGECALLLAILRPWSYCRSWGRALSASLLALVLSSLWIQGVLHSPPYFGVHLQWWLLVSLGLLLLTLFSAASAWRHARKARPKK